MNWTQPICGECYWHREPMREPIRLKGEFAEQEICCDCGNPTREGLYFRVDPRTVKFPAEEKS